MARSGHFRLVMGFLAQLNEATPGSEPVPLRSQTPTYPWQHGRSAASMASSRPDLFRFIVTDLPELNDVLMSAFEGGAILVPALLDVSGKRVFDPLALLADLKAVLAADRATWTRGSKPAVRGRVAAKNGFPC